jgi:hypothetical protein
MSNTLPPFGHQQDSGKRPLAESRELTADSLARMSKYMFAVEPTMEYAYLPMSQNLKSAAENLPAWSRKCAWKDRRGIDSKPVEVRRG